LFGIQSNIRFFNQMNNFFYFFKIKMHNGLIYL